MKTFIEPEVEIVKLEVADIICESVQYDKYFDTNIGDDFIGWG